MTGQTDYLVKVEQFDSVKSSHTTIYKNNKAALLTLVCPQKSQNQKDLFHFLVDYQDFRILFMGRERSRRRKSNPEVMEGKFFTLRAFYFHFTHKNDCQHQHILVLDF